MKGIVFIYELNDHWVLVYIINRALKKPGRINYRAFI
jgi:hypothetical protein